MTVFDGLPLMDNMTGMFFVADNVAGLKERGWYEEAPVDAYCAARLNHAAAGWKLNELVALFEQADRERLRQVAPIPAGEVFALYRGVAEASLDMEGDFDPRFRGLSWTRSLDVAAWCACRFCDELPADALPLPVVVRAEIPRERIWCYINERGEDGFVGLADEFEELEHEPAEFREMSERWHREKVEQ